MDLSKRVIVRKEKKKKTTEKLSVPESVCAHRERLRERDTHTQRRTETHTDAHVLVVTV